jgi:hypothetical protein
MFNDLYDAISLLWSWRWPVAEGEVTAVDIERMRHDRNSDTARLAVAYEFSVGDDGPYTGECFWVPAFCSVRRIASARRKPHIRDPLRVRYRPGDPSVNTLDGGVARLLRMSDFTTSPGHRD